MSVHFVTFCLQVISAGTTGVLVSLGGKTKDVGETMLTTGTGNVISAMKAAGVKRVAVVTSIGAGDSSGQAPIVFKVCALLASCSSLCHL